jgi:hypothetical protein
MIQPVTSRTVGGVGPGGGWAVLDRAARGWRGVDQRPANVRLLQQLRRDLLDPVSAHQGTVDVSEPATAAA